MTQLCMDINDSPTVSLALVLDVLMVACHEYIYVHLRVNCTIISYILLLTPHLLFIPHETDWKLNTLGMSTLQLYIRLPRKQTSDSSDRLSPSSTLVFSTGATIMMKCFSSASKITSLPAWTITSMLSDPTDSQRIQFKQTLDLNNRYQLI